MSLPKPSAFSLTEGTFGQGSGSRPLVPVPWPGTAQVVASGPLRQGSRARGAFPPGRSKQAGPQSLRGLQKYNRGRRTHQRRGLAYQCMGWLQTAKFVKNVSGRASLADFRGFGLLSLWNHRITQAVFTWKGRGRGPNPPRAAHALISHSRLELMCVSATWGGGRVLFGGFIRHPHVTPKLFLPALGESG